jgi:hypothetical protein
MGRLLGKPVTATRWKPYPTTVFGFFLGPTLSAPTLGGSHPGVAFIGYTGDIVKTF